MDTQSTSPSWFGATDSVTNYKQRGEIMSEGEIDIKGLDKAAVLAALYNASQQQGMGFSHPRGTCAMTVEEAREALKGRDDNGNRDMYFDYLHGRVMKVDLSGDTLKTWLYDRDNGQGAAERALRKLRGRKAT